MVRVWRVVKGIKDWSQKSKLGGDCFNNPVKSRMIRIKKTTVRMGRSGQMGETGINKID